MLEGKHRAIWEMSANRRKSNLWKGKRGAREKNQTRGEEAGEISGMCNMRFLSARSEVQGGHERGKNQYGSDDAKEWEA